MDLRNWVHGLGTSSTISGIVANHAVTMPLFEGELEDVDVYQHSQLFAGTLVISATSCS